MEEDARMVQKRGSSEGEKDREEDPHGKRATNLDQTRPRLPT